MLVAGDEFGPLGGLPGSDSLLLVPKAGGAPVVSVGAEPTGVPAGVVHLGGGPEAFVAILEDQLERRRRGDVPDVAADPGWTFTADDVDPELERSHEALLVLADGRLGTNGSPTWRHAAAAPRVLAAGVYDGDGPATELLPAPTWHELATGLPADATLRRPLDLRTDLLHQTFETREGEAAALAFSSLARPGTVALRAQRASGARQPRRGAADARQARRARPLIGWRRLRRRAGKHRGCGRGGCRDRIVRSPRATRGLRVRTSGATGDQAVRCTNTISLQISRSGG